MFIFITFFLIFVLAMWAMTKEPKDEFVYLDLGKLDFEHKSIVEDALSIVKNEGKKSCKLINKVNYSGYESPKIKIDVFYLGQVEKLYKVAIQVRVSKDWLLVYSIGKKKLAHEFRVNKYLKGGWTNHVKEHAYEYLPTWKKGYGIRGKQKFEPYEESGGRDYFNAYD